MDNKQEKDLRKLTEEMMDKFNEVDRSLLQRAVEHCTEDWKFYCDDVEDYYDFIPLYGTVWEPIGIDLKSEENIQKALDCDFIVMVDNYAGTYYLGIDTLGEYDIVDMHFIPLYKEFFNK